MVHAQLFRRHRVASGGSPFHPIGRILRGVVGFVIMASLLILALMVAFGVLVWAALKGQRPWAVARTARGFAARSSGPRPSDTAPGTGGKEVIDIVAREVVTSSR